jgi:hypothetical protein
LIYARGDDKAWLFSTECVWEGPEWLKSVHPLPSMPEYNGLNHFFRDVLKVRNANHHDYLDDLRLMREQNDVDMIKATHIYHLLKREFQNDQSGQSLR